MPDDDLGPDLRRQMTAEAVALLAEPWHSRLGASQPLGAPVAGVVSLFFAASLPIPKALLVELSMCIVLEGVVNFELRQTLFVESEVVGFDVGWEAGIAKHPYLHQRLADNVGILEDIDLESLDLASLVSTALVVIALAVRVNTTEEEVPVQEVDHGWVEQVAGL